MRVKFHNEINDFRDLNKLGAEIVTHLPFELLHNFRS